MCAVLKLCNLLHSLSVTGFSAEHGIKFPFSGGEMMNNWH